MKVEFNGSNMRAEMNTPHFIDVNGQETSRRIDWFIKEYLSIILGILSNISALALIPTGMLLSIYYGMSFTKILTIPMVNILLIAFPCLLATACSVSSGVISIVIGGKSRKVQAKIGLILSIVGFTVCAVSNILYLAMFIYR